MANKSNALKALLSSKAEATQTVPVKRLGVDFTLRALGDGELERINEQAKGPDGKLDEATAKKALIATAVVDPSFSDPEVLEQFGAATAADAVGKALLVGEITVLQQKVLEISGFDFEIMQAKN